jgi:hypothetical protein
LSRDVVEALLDRAPSDQLPPKEVRDVAETALSRGSEAAIQRWWIEHGIRVVASDEARAAEPAHHATVDNRTLAGALAAGETLDSILDQLAPLAIDQFDSEALALLEAHPWIAAQREHAHRALVRCVELQRARPDEAATLETVRTQIGERSRSWNLDDWSGVLFECFGGDSRPGLAEAIQRRPYCLDFEPSNFVGDCVRLGVVDEVLRALETLDDQTHIGRACDLLDVAGDAGARAAVAVIRERILTDPRPFAPDELLPWLTVEDVVARWDTFVSTSSHSMMINARALVKVGGVALVDRIGDQLANLLAQSRAPVLPD